MNVVGRRVRVAVGVAVALSLLVTVAPAGAREFELHGRSTESGCQSDARVKFNVDIQRGTFKRVWDFEAKDFNYPNLTPPIPRGHPTGHCLPGEDHWVSWYFHQPGGSITYSIPFGAGHLDANEFFAAYKYPSTGDIVTENAVYGIVHVKKVHRHHAVFLVRAHGWFLSALSEAGLKYGGGSTGAVDWKASN